MGRTHCQLQSCFNTQNYWPPISVVLFILIISNGDRFRIHKLQLLLSADQTVKSFLMLSESGFSSRPKWLNGEAQEEVISQILKTAIARWKDRKKFFSPQTPAILIPEPKSFRKFGDIQVHKFETPYSTKIIHSQFLLFGGIRDIYDFGVYINIGIKENSKISFLQEQYNPENRPIDIFALDILINQSRQIPVAHSKKNRRMCNTVINHLL